MDDSHPPLFSSSHATDPGEDTPEIRDPAPQYQGDDVWAHWKMVDTAYRAVTASQDLLAELESELRAKTEKGTQLKERSSKLFETVHRKPRLRLPPSLKRIRSNSVSGVTEDKESALQEFELAHKEETACMLQIEELTTKVESLKENVQQNIVLASSVDQVFELLGASASVVATSPDYETHTSSDEQLATASTSYNQKQMLVADFTRARVTVQHSHHYYTTVLKTIDSIRGTTFGRILVGGMGEVSKQQDYKVALNTAYKAQVCFNETVRVLTPHIAILPPDILGDFKALRDMGLLQASKIYGLMYGWKSKTSGITKSVELMLKRQEDIFAKLTHLAVWIQDEVPVCEAQLRAARDSRDQVRRDLVMHWNRQRHATLDISSETG